MFIERLFGFLYRLFCLAGIAVFAVFATVAIDAPKGAEVGGMLVLGAALGAGVWGVGRALYWAGTGN